MYFQRIKDVRKPSTRKGDAGIDFYIPFDFNDGDLYVIKPHEDVNIPLGVCVHLPPQTALLACNKSGIATKKKLINGAQLVDPNYTGEIHAHMINTSNEEQTIIPGQKITQFILIPYISTELKETILEDRKTNRGKGCFGSTGLGI